MKIRMFLGMLLVSAFLLSLAATPAWADCSGEEKLRTRCKVLNDGNNKLKVVVLRSVPHSNVVVLLDGEPIGEIKTNSKGKGRLIRTHVGDGPHMVEVCGVQRPTSCGQ